MEFVISCSKLLPYLGRCLGNFMEMEGRLPRLARYSERLHLLKTELYDRLVTADRRKLDIAQRLLRIIRKHCKDYNLNGLQADNLFESCYCTVNEHLRQLENRYYKEDRTDCEATLYKRSVTSEPVLQQLPLPTIRHPPVEIGQLTMNFEWQFQTVSSLCSFGKQIFETLPMTSRLQLTESQLSSFFCEFSQQYNVLPYHNFTHAMSVMMMFYQLYNQSRLKEFVNDFEILWVLVACLAHDVAHEGVNNLFHAKAKTQTAMDYSYTAVMEQMHLSKTINFLNTKAGYMMASLTPAEKDRARKIIFKAILSTDMARHFKYVDQLRDRTGNHLPISARYPTTVSKSIAPFNKDREADRDFMIEIFVHACDIGTPCLNFDNYIHWANMLCLQFHGQTNVEDRYGVEMTSFLRFSSLQNSYSNQITFANSVVLPLWTQIGNVFQELREYREQIVRNIRQLQENIKRKPTDKALVKRYID